MIQDRQSWDARDPRCRSTTTVSELYLHHSVGSGMRDKDGDGDLGDDYMRQMQNQHMAPGWAGTTNGGCDIAYNHAYDPDGREFYEGRGFGIRPGAQKNHNTGTHSLVVMGDYRVRPVTSQMVADIAGFYADAIDAGLLPNVTVRGHQQAPGQSTSCPGTNLMAALPAINNRIEELLMVNYRGVKNVPEDRDGNAKAWAKDVIDWGVSVGLINIADDNPDDWERQLVDGRYWTFEYRRRNAGGSGATPGEVDAKIAAHADNPDAHHE